MLELLDQLASIGTALLAAFAYGQWRLVKHSKRRRLEDYLEAAPHTISQTDEGRRTILHLVAALGLTEADILDAAFTSKKIIRSVTTDPVTNRADCLLLEFKN